MARDYGRIRTSFWDDDRIKPLSMAEKMVAAYLLTSNHTNAIGCFKLPLAYVADDLGVEAKSLEPIFANLRGAHFIKWCERVPWLWIPNYLKHNPPETPNVWRRCVAEMKLLPVEISARAHIAEELFRIAAEERMKTITAEEKTKLDAFRKHDEGINHASAMHEPCTTRARPVPSPVPSPGPSPGPGPVPGPKETTKEESKSAQQAAPLAVKRKDMGTRWSSEDRVSDEWVEDAVSAAHNLGLPRVDLRREAAKFEHYWASKAGANGRKVNWRLTWLGWAQKAAEDGQGRLGRQGGQGRKPSAHDNFLAAAAKLAHPEAGSDGSADQPHPGPPRPALLAS